MIGNRKIAAICLTKIQDADSSQKLVDSLTVNLAKIGYSLFVYSTDADMFWNTLNEQGEQRVFDLVDYDVVDALIVYSESIKSGQVCKEMIQKARERNVPVLVVEGTYDDCINLNFDYTEGFAKVVRHVLDEHKVTKVHFMAGLKGNEFSETRYRVVEKLMHERGLSFDRSNVSYGDFWEDPTRRAVLELLRTRRELPQAIVCANDAMALAVCATLREHGIGVPEQVIVTGFDGIDEIFFSKPQITSCLCSFEVMGERIAEFLNDPRPYEQLRGDYKVMPSLILSESCGCIPEKQVNVPEYISSINLRFSRFQDEQRVMNKIAAKIQVCDNISMAAAELKNAYMYDCCVLLKNEVLDEWVNPTTMQTSTSFGRQMTLVHSSLDGELFVPCQFDIKDIVPHIDRLLEAGISPVFTAIHAMQIPLGYACFFYHDKDAYSYYKIFQITGMLNSAFSGYRNIRYQRCLQKRIEDSYKLDALTGYYNRNGFFREFEVLLEKIKNDKKTLIMGLADLDNLKYINDTFGHAVGDKAICAIAKALRQAFPGAIFCRFGGDELLAVKEKNSDTSLIRRRMEASLHDYNETSGIPFDFSASLGIYETQDLSQMNFDTLLVKADEIMYEEKRKKKIKRGVN